MVAVAGVSGAGKTTLARSLASRLDGAGPLFFDEYPKVGPGITPWLSSGADPADWQTPELVEHLTMLRGGQTIELRNDGGQLEPSEFLVVEEPFGRSRPDIEPCIDFVVFLDLALEVALARRMIRDMATCWHDKDRAQLESEIKQYMTWYVAEGARVYARLRELAMQGCDAVLDGMQDPHELVDECERMVRRAAGKSVAAGMPLD